MTVHLKNKLYFTSITQKFQQTCRRVLEGGDVFFYYFDLSRCKRSVVIRGEGNRGTRGKPSNMDGRDHNFVTC